MYINLVYIYSDIILYHLKRIRDTQNKMTTTFQLTLSSDKFHVYEIGSSEVKPNTFAIRVGEIVPIGEWSDWFQNGDIKERTKQGFKHWKYTKDKPVCVNFHNRNVLIVGDFCELTSPSYFSQRDIPEELHDHDICLYCGHSNGKSGELRQGWDCYYCGGN